MQPVKDAVVYVVDDDVGVRDALAWLLASYLAGPILKGDAGMAMAQRAAQMAQMM